MGFSSSAHLFDHFDQLGVEYAVTAARLTNFPMVKVYAANIANAGICRNPRSARSCSLSMEKSRKRIKQSKREVTICCIYLARVRKLSTYRPNRFQRYEGITPTSVSMPFRRS